MHITLKSDNGKTGGIPVSTSPNYTCPPSCRMLKEGTCYAKGGPLAIHWDKVSTGERGSGWNAFLNALESLPDGQVWRHNQAGDLPGYGDEIDCDKIMDLVAAQNGKRGFTYTHKPVIDGEFAAPNRWAIWFANVGGFTVNLSANSLSEADALANLKIAPVVAIVPRGSPATQYTPEGRKGIVCPAQRVPGITCSGCMLCQKRREVVVLFWAHGSRAKKVDAICSR